MGDNKYVPLIIKSDDADPIKYYSTSFLELFLNKSIVKTDFDPYFLVRFPYRNRGKNRLLSYFSKAKVS